MIEKEQIAHDLAVAKLYGSEFPTEDLIKQYRQYNDEILSVLKSEPRQIKPAKIGRSSIRYALLPRKYLTKHSEP